MNVTSSSVLVVDDDSATRTVVQEYLAQEGYEVRAVSSVQEAVALLHSAPVALVLSDDCTGTAGDRWMMLDHLKAHAGTTPVIIFTAHLERQFSGFHARGFAGLLPKPFDLDDLVMIVRRTLDAPPRR